MKTNNKYYILRHGESVSNKKEIISCSPNDPRFPLTLKGKKQVKRSAEELKDKAIDFIFSSDILRVKETAEIVGKELNLKPKLDKRLREYKVGIFNGKKIDEFRKYFPDEGKKRFKEKPKGGETYFEMVKRMTDFLKEIDKKYKNRNILIISHQLPLTFLEGWAKGFSPQESLKKIPKQERIDTGEWRLLK